MLIYFSFLYYYLAGRQAEETYDWQWWFLLSRISESIKLFKFLRSREEKYLVLEIKVLEAAYLRLMEISSSCGNTAVFHISAPYHTTPCWDAAPSCFSLSTFSYFGCRSTVNFSTWEHRHRWESHWALPMQDMETQNPSPVKQGTATSSPCPGALLLLQRTKTNMRRFSEQDMVPLLWTMAKYVTQEGATPSPRNRELANATCLLFAINYFRRLQCVI